MNILEHGTPPNEWEIYSCTYCGCKFEISASERMTTFTLHKPNYWSCPECGTECFTVLKRIGENNEY